MVTGRILCNRGALNTELVFALGVLVSVMMPMAYAFIEEAKTARIYYQDAIAMEILDGETEALAAGNWKAYPEGEHQLQVSGAAVTNLPPGRFVLTRSAKALRVEWQPTKGRRMIREVKLP